MVKSSTKGYYCEECKLIYEDRDWAEKCEGWCRKRKSCNLEVTKHSTLKIFGGLNG